MLFERPLRSRLTSSISRVSTWRCTVYGRAFTAHGKPYPLPSVTHNARTYSTTTPLPRTAFGVVTTNAPLQTTIDQLLEPLRTVPSFPTQNVPHSSTIARLVLLITPSFAQHALDQQLPVKAYELLKVHKDGLKTIETVTAVVDRVPARLATQKEGREGMAYLFTLVENIEMEIAEEPVSSQEPVIGFRGKPTTPFQGKPGTLTFTMLGKASPYLPQHTLELPLTHTIFSTQRVSTLIRTIYNIDQDQRLYAQSQQEPRTLNISLPTRSATDWRCVELPLIPLTPARRVKYSMGNILRQLWNTTDTTPGQDADDPKAQTASEELEKAVSSYFDTVRLDPQAVAVWAVIIPKTAAPSQKDLAAGQLLQMQPDEIKARWSSDHEFRSGVRKHVSEAVLSLIHRGAKLCKVLSGGGGWGKKAGLLSLDPDNSYAITEHGNIKSNPARIPGMNSTSLDEDTPSTFGQIAEVGDQVMFFLAPESLDALKSSNDQTTPTGHATGGIRKANCFIFGALPSSIDSAPLDTAGLNGVDIAYEPSLFGMLSEGGMALEVSPPNAAASKSEVIRTKLDVPFARFYGTKRPRTIMRRVIDKASQEGTQTPETKIDPHETEHLSAAGEQDRAQSLQKLKIKGISREKTRAKIRYFASRSTEEFSATSRYNDHSLASIPTSTFRKVRGLRLRKVATKRMRPRQNEIDLDSINSPERHRARHEHDRAMDERHQSPEMADVYRMMAQSELHNPDTGRAVADGLQDDLRRRIADDVGGLVSLAVGQMADSNGPGPSTPNDTRSTRSKG